jgi:cytochrome bd-type quinol oxidase subunit 2
MKNETKIRIARWIAIPFVILGLRFAAGGRIWDYMVDHLWLAAVLPLIVLLLLLFGRGMYIQYRRQREGNAKIAGAQKIRL